MAQITIDFFELAFLAEACIPPRPIARAMFWERLINEIHNDMETDERERLFDWVIKNPNFNLENEDCQWFFARFNPENQYRVHYEYEGEKGEKLAFLKDGSYYLTKSTSIESKYIINVERF